MSAEHKRSTVGEVVGGVATPQTRAARARLVAKATRLSRLGRPVPLVGPIVPAGRVLVAGRVFGVGRDRLGRWVLTSAHGVRYVLRSTHRAAGELLAVTSLAPSRSLPATFTVEPGPRGPRVLVLS